MQTKSTHDLITVFSVPANRHLWQRALLFLLLFMGSIAGASAQFYSEGVETPRKKWQQMENSRYRLIYPRGFEEGASRYAKTLDLVHPWINYNFRDTVRKIPIILRTQNNLSNGFVTWAPKRGEFITSNAGNTYALPWYKQLAAHEGRHVAQMSIMKTGLTKFAMWVLGEAGIALGLLVMDDWQLEGDAVLAETQMAEFGRGLQPEFTLGYRGFAAAGKLNFKKIDPWIHGSYKRLIPGIYEYGYQVVSAAETYVADTLWYEMARYSARNPIFVFPDRIWINKKYKTNYGDIARRAFAELDSIWKPTYSIENSYRIITPNHKIHTNHIHPLPYKGKILAAKWDMDISNRIMIIDTASGIERELSSAGYLTSKPVLHGDIVYWTELKPHMFYEQQNYSVVRSYNLKEKKRRLHNKHGYIYHVTPLPDSTFASVTFDSQSKGMILITKDDFRKELKCYKFSEPLTLHGLTWDNWSNKLYYIALSDRGMWIGGIGKDGIPFEITKPSVVTIRDLRAANGILYFSSIQSGKNEIHTIDLRNGDEYRQTESKLAAISASAIDSNEIVFTAYTPMGWAIAKSEHRNLEKVEWSRLPRNTLNPKRYQWNVPKIDTVQIIADTTEILEQSRKFKKMGHGFSVHSWAPIPFAGSFDLSESAALKLGFGVTAFFQSRLSEIQGFLSYGYVDKMHWWKTNIAYMGLPVKMTFDLEYGGKRQQIYLPADSVSYPSLRRKPFMEVSSTFSLPMNFSLGGNTRILEPSLRIKHVNSRYHNNALDKYSDNVQTYEVALYWSNIRNKGSRLILPRLGYVLKASTSGAIKKDFSTIFAISGRAYIPGIAKNHSIYIESTFQHQLTHNGYKLSDKSMIPRGVTNNFAAKNYVAMRSGYMMPLIYPDTGIEGMLYLKRVSIELFRDSSWGRYFTNDPNKYAKLMHHSTGASLAIENILFNIFPNTMYFTFSHTSQENFRFGFSINFAFGD